MSEIIIIGGITVDIEGHPHQQLVFQDSNPGKISIAYGGVGRNIAENLARLGATVSFYSVVGNDMPGRGALRDLSDLGVDVSGTFILEDENTAMYLSILNLVGDMELALCNMDALERISTDLIDQAALASNEVKMVALDTNLTEETLAYAVDRFRGKPLFLDPVSTAKAKRAREVIGRFHTIKPNRAEAEVLSGIEILDPQALNKAGDWFLEQGVKRVFITLSSGGVYYQDETTTGILPGMAKIADSGSATGAGDAFSAAVLYGFLREENTVDLARLGMAAASIGMESKAAVNPLMSREELERRAR